MKKNMYLVLGLIFLLLTIIFAATMAVTWFIDPMTATFLAVIVVGTIIGTSACFFWAAYHHFFMGD